MNRPVVELDLALGGSASAGAYTAGATEFISQAVACLHAAQTADPDRFPGPVIHIRPRALTAAGIVNATLFNQASGAAPFKQVWIETLDLRDAFGHARDRNGATHGLRLFDPGCLDSVMRRLPIQPAYTMAERAADHTITLVIDPSPDACSPDAISQPDGAASLFLNSEATRRASPPASMDTHYWICPERSHRPGVALRPALASTSLDGFGGYLDARFRAFDFALGRRNAQRALARHLTLPSDHPLVADWPEALDQAFGVWPRGIAPVGRAPGRPLIPLTGDAARICPLPDWPALTPKDLRKLDPLIAARVERIAREAANRFLGDSLWQPVAQLAIAGRKRTVARQTRAALTQALQASGQIAADKPRGLSGLFNRRSKPA